MRYAIPILLLAFLLPLAGTAHGQTYSLEAGATAVASGSLDRAAGAEVAVGVEWFSSAPMHVSVGLTQYKRDTWAPYQLQGTIGVVPKLFGPLSLRVGIGVDRLWKDPAIASTRLSGELGATVDISSRFAVVVVSRGRLGFPILSTLGVRVAWIF
jgi:hypothetical protein